MSGGGLQLHAGSGTEGCQHIPGCCISNPAAFTLPQRLPQLGPELFTQDVTPHTPLVVETLVPVGLLSGLRLRGFGSVADVGSSVLIYDDKCLWASC